MSWPEEEQQQTSTPNMTMMKCRRKWDIKFHFVRTFANYANRSSSSSPSFVSLSISLSHFPTTHSRPLWVCIFLCGKLSSGCITFYLYFVMLLLPYYSNLLNKYGPHPQGRNCRALSSIPPHRIWNILLALLLLPL